MFALTVARWGEGKKIAAWQGEKKDTIGHMLQMHQIIDLDGP